VVLADRLPKLAALFEAGLINEAVVRAIEYRTAMVTDDQAISRVDALVAEQVKVWGPLSVRKTEQAIDAIVDQVDPAALRRSRKSSCARDVTFGSPSDEPGYTSMWARLYGPAAVVLEQRVEEMARGVCEDDSRTLGGGAAKRWPRSALASPSWPANAVAPAAPRPRVMRVHRPPR
jgi:hypothetical protein